MTASIKTIAVSDRQKKAVIDLMFEFRLPNKSVTLNEALCLMDCYRLNLWDQPWTFRSNEREYTERFGLQLTHGRWETLNDYRIYFRMPSVAAVVREAIELLILYSEREGTSIVPSNNYEFSP